MGMLEVMGKWLLNLSPYYSVAIILVVVIALFVVTPKILRWVILKAQLGKVRIADGIEYYPNRKALGLPEDVFRKTQRAYALWFTGAGAKRENIHKRGQFEKIIFMNPPPDTTEDDMPQYLAFLNNASDNPTGVQNMISLISNEAKNADVKVKYLKKLPRIILVISNLPPPDDWILLEQVDFSKAAREWKSYKIYESKHLGLCKYFRNLYELLWALGEDDLE